MTTLTYQGKPCCACQLEWLTVFQQELAARGLPPLQIAQLIGNAPASAGRHLGGGSIDWWSVDVATARLAREFGGLAMIRDGSRDSFDNNKHTHTYLVGCPHMNVGAKSDLAEVLKGGDGLVGSTPDDPRLKGAYTGLTWKQGVTEMKLLQRRRARLRTFGGHNLLDGKGRASGFADIIGFTEAPSVLEVLRDLGPEYYAKECGLQKDLVIAWRKDRDIRIKGDRYFPAHPGRKLVTPARGTWKIRFGVLSEDVEVILDHRINAAFPPFIRGEKVFRLAMWKLHTGISKALARRAKRRGHIVVALGDPNCSPSMTAYGKVLPHEYGAPEKDRIASNRRLVDGETLSKEGSDHHRIRAGIQF